MICKRCEKFWAAVYARIDEWEIDASNESALFSEESDEARDLIKRAQDSDPSSALQLYIGAAEAGSTWSLEMIGWHYWTGTGVAADPYKALEYYYRAIGRGSWMATIYYARLLAELGHYDDCEQTLANGIAADFAPSYYWSAWFRYERSRISKVCRDVRPLLEFAAAKGHPGAITLLARWMMLGKLGLRNIPQGFRLAFQFIFRNNYSRAF